MKRASSKAKRQAVGRSVPTCCSPFQSGTGLMGFTESGQRVTADNAHFLPPGSVVRLDAGGRLIHLHDGLWLYCTDCSWCATWRKVRQMTTQNPSRQTSAARKAP